MTGGRGSETPVEDDGVDGSGIPTGVTILFGGYDRRFHGDDGPSG